MIRLNAYAKLNLALDVLGRRADNYHELDTIMQSISLCDTVAIEKADGINVCMDKELTEPRSNTAYIAAKMFAEQTGISGASITIEKRIPSEAGLGGASADAAAVLVGLDAIYDTKLSMQTLQDIGKRIGADVPFALMGGTARAKGIGEKLGKLKLSKPLYFVVVKPYQGVSTAQAFGEFRASEPVRMESVAYALQKGDVEMFNKYSRNALGMAALRIAPQIMNAASALGQHGKAFMSGSGSSMFAIFATAEQAQAAADSISGDFELCGAYCSKEIGVQIIGDKL